MNNSLFYFVNERHDISTRAVTNNCLVPEKCNLDVRKYFFSNRVVNNWNVLPQDIRNAESVNDFKNRFDDWNSIDNDASLVQF